MINFECMYNMYINLCKSDNGYFNYQQYKSAYDIPVLYMILLQADGVPQERHYHKQGLNITKFELQSSTGQLQISCLLQLLYTFKIFTISLPQKYQAKYKVIQTNSTIQV